MIGTVLISAVLGLVLVELALRLAAICRLQPRYYNVLARLKEYQVAKGDAARQLALLNSGFATLQFSLRMLIVMATLFGIAMLPLTQLHWTNAQICVYFSTISVCATLWRWINIRKRHFRLKAKVAS
jgi:hypothetical protein